MPFNGNGVFSIVNTFTPGTTISSSAMNGNFSDIATGLSDCLTRDGQAPMTAPLKLVSGNSSTPALAFAAEPTLGFYRSASATMGLAGGLDLSGAVTIGGDAIIPIGLGPLPWSGTTAPPLWVLSGATYSRATYAALWAFAQTQISGGNTFYGIGDGSTTFTIGTMDGYVPAGVDAAAARISSFTHVGDTAGFAGVNLQVGQIPTLTSSASPSLSVSTTSTNFVGSNSSDATALSATAGGAVGGVSAGGGFSVGHLASTGTASGTVTSTTTGTGGAVGAVHTNIQPSRAFKFIVYAGA